MKTAKKQKTKSGGIGWAVLLICVGLLLLLTNLEIIPAIYKPLLISWQFLLILLGVWSLLKRHYLGGLSLIIVGVIFIYPKLYSIFPSDLMEININFQTYWPILLILVGLFLILGKNKYHNKIKKQINSYSEKNKSESQVFDSDSFNKDEYINKNLMFGSSEQIIFSQNIKGGDVNVMFGELKLDLRKAQLNNGVIKLETNVMFGSAILYIPSNWIVEIQNSSLFGGFQDNREMIEHDENIADTPRIIITGGILFGTGEIKN